VPATNELIQLNNKWQRQIKDEKERRRNACISASMENNCMEQNDTEENQILETTDAGMLSNYDNNDQSLNFMYTTPVTKIAIPGETTRNDIAQRFTLNKNQKAAFMIITGHLDGIGTMNEGSNIQ
jgi:hypothetical protein